MLYGSRGKLILVMVGGIILGLAILCSQVFSYDTDIAHPYLTENIAEIYNQNSDLKLSDQEIDWLKKGSIEEDIPPRWMNHFYNSQTNLGILGFPTSKEWAQNPIYQVGYPRGNQSWQKAIDSYARGNDQESFIALGHILHLIEDTTVPAHTRADIHIFGDSYENWVKNNAINNTMRVDFVGYFDNLNDYFDFLARYSNNYFLSDDTIKSDEIEKLNIEEKEVKLSDGKYKLYGFLKDPDGVKFKFVKIEKLLDSKKYSIDDIILSDYYSLFAPKAVSYGAGVIELFFKEVEKRKAEIEQEKSAQEQKSWWQKVKDRFGSINIFSSISGPIVSKNPASPGPAESIYPPASSAATPPVQTAVPLPRVILPQGRVVVARQGEAENNQIIEQTSPQDRQIPSEITENKSPQDAVLPSISLSPSPIATTTFSYFERVNGLAQEEQETTEQASSSTPAVVPKISISLAGYSLFARSFFVTWQSSSSNILFSVQQKQDLGDWQEWVNATTSTSTLFQVPQDLTDYYFRARASDFNNATSTWAEISAPINFYPVVINEIAWAGTSTSTSVDEWIELYNKTSEPIDLSGWILRSASDNTPSSTLVGKVEPNGFFLLERTGDDTIIDVPADQIYTGALNNTGETMELLDKFGNLIDRIPLSDSNKWLAGSGNPNYQSMERVNPYLPADVPGIWQSNSTSTRNGLNADGQPINGTPKAQNSVFDLNFFYLYPAQNTTATSTVLRWTQSSLPNLKEYKIARSFDLASSTPEIIANVADNAFFDGTLESETEYYYRILACDSSDNCATSNSISTTTPEFPFVWSEPQIISGNSASSTAEFSPDIVLANNGLPVVIWYSATSTDARYIKVSQKDQNNNWSEPEVVSAGFMPHGYPPQILRGADSFEVLYTGEPPAVTWRPPIFDIFDVRASANVWGEPRQISDSGYVNFSPSGVIDNLGVTHIVWQARSTTTPENFIFYLSIDASGAPLGEAIKIASSSDGFLPNIVLDSQNRLHAAWFSCSAGGVCESIYYSVNNQDGTGWSEAKKIFTFSQTWGFGRKPEMIFDKDGKLLLTWEWRLYEIRLAEFDGAATTSEKIFKQEYKILNAPNLVFNNKGKLYLLWVGWNDSGAGFGLYFTSLNSKNEWQPIKKVFESMEAIRLPRVAVAADNTMHLVWYGGEGGDRIYYMFSSIE